jgi:hypothetical protein
MEEVRMLKDSLNKRLLSRSALAAVLCGAALLPASAQDSAKGKIPDFMGTGVGWDSAGGLTPVPGSPSPVTQDPNVKYAGNADSRATGEQPTWRYADLNNPNLTEFAKAGLKKANDMVDSGFALYNRTSRCWMPGIPTLDISPGRTYFIQTPKVVYIMWQRDQIVRRVPLDVPHTDNPKPSWHGESVGRYEGDTLVVDTIAQTTKNFVDLFRTPHSDKLHIVERFRMIEGGKALQVEFTVEDPASFVKPWKATKRWEKVAVQPYAPNTTGTYNDEIRCMEGESVNPWNQEYAEILEPLPTADKPAF